MIDLVISDLKDTKRDIENEFKGWLKFATDMAASFVVDPEKPRTAKCWRRYKDNVLVLTIRVATVDQFLFL